MKYNYVFFLPDLDCYQYVAREASALEDVKLKFGCVSDKRPIVRLLHRIHFSSRTNNVLELPFKKLWNRFYFTNNFGNVKPICFVIARTMDYYFKKTDYYSYLRKNYIGCKMIFLFFDRVEKTQQPFNVDKREILRSTFDRVMAYSLLDAEKFNFTYFPSFESMTKVEKRATYADVDIFYAGSAKDRVKMIQETCRRANQHGLKCYFYVYGATKVESIPMEGMIYSNQWMPFSELTERAASARCLLDVLQGEAAGFTSRFWHAIFYNKLLISNNPLIQFTKYYKSDSMQVITDANDIDFSIFEKSIDSIDYKYNGEFSPINFIRFLEDSMDKIVLPEDFYKDWFDIRGYKRLLSETIGMKHNEK